MDDPREIEKYLDDVDNENEAAGIRDADQALHDADVLERFEEEQQREEAKKLEEYLSRVPDFTLEDEMPEKLRF